MPLRHHIVLTHSGVLHHADPRRDAVHVYTSTDGAILNLPLHDISSIATGSIPAAPTTIDITITPRWSQPPRSVTFEERHCPSKLGHSQHLWQPGGEGEFVLCPGDGRG